MALGPMDFSGSVSDEAGARGSAKQMEYESDTISMNK